MYTYTYYSVNYLHISKFRKNSISFRTARCGLSETHRSGRRPNSVVPVSGLVGRARTAVVGLRVVVRSVVVALERTEKFPRQNVEAGTTAMIVAGRQAVVAVVAFVVV